MRALASRYCYSLLLSAALTGCEADLFQFDHSPVDPERVIVLERAREGTLLADGLVADTFFAVISGRATETAVTFRTTAGRFHLTGGSEQTVTAVARHPADTVLTASAILLAPDSAQSGVVSASILHYVDWLEVSFIPPDEET